MRVEHPRVIHRVMEGDSRREPVSSDEAQAGEDWLELLGGKHRSPKQFARIRLQGRQVIVSGALGPN